MPSVAESEGKKRGKSFSDDELMALMDAYAKVSFDSVTGANQTAARFQASIMAEFLQNKRCPPPENMMDDIHYGRWNERSAVSCKRKIDDVRSKCSKFRAMVNRVEGAVVTGSPTEAGIDRCATYLYNGNITDKAILYKIASEAEDAPDVGKPFPYANILTYMECHEGLRRIVNASSDALGTIPLPSASSPSPTRSLFSNQHDDDDESPTSDSECVSGEKFSRRPKGTKSTQKARNVESQRKRDSDVMASIASSIKTMTETRKKKRS